MQASTGTRSHKLATVHSLHVCRKEYSESGEKLGRFDEQRFGEVITDESSVELAIKRAQKAVLNPGKHNID